MAANIFQKSLIKFLGLDEQSKEVVRFKKAEKSDENDLYTNKIHETLMFHENGYWYFGVIIKIHPDGRINSHPHDIIRVNVYVRSENEKVFYKLYSYAEEYEVDMKNLEEHFLQVGIPEVYNWIYSFYERQANYFSDKYSIEREMVLTVFETKEE